MTAFPRQTLLDLRQRAEKAAEKMLTVAMSARARAEADQTALEAAVTQAREALREAQDGLHNPRSGAEAATSEAFRARLTDVVKAQAVAAETHRRSILVPAASVEEAARIALLTARQDRETIEKLIEQEAARARTIADRRQEDERGDLALAAMQGNKPRGDRRR